MSSWLKKEPTFIRDLNSLDKRFFPEGLWRRCPKCLRILYTEEWEKNYRVCIHCHYHTPLSARSRIFFLLDALPKCVEIASEIAPLDPLDFCDQQSYLKRLEEAREKSSEKEALVVVSGFLCKIPLVLAVFDFSFMGGSMGSVVGERFIRGIRYALDNRCPFVCCTSSGGARMQEGVFSLMQMAKVNLGAHWLAEARLPFITLLAHPTMGGVSASFVFISDIVLAEPDALIGFAGPRVIKQIMQQDLPEGFQTAEFVFEKGGIDMMVHRYHLRTKLASLLSLLFKYA